MLKKSIIIIALLLPLALSAQMGKLIGTVVDEETKEPLSAVNIIIQGTKLGAATDQNGHFFMSLSPGKYNLRVLVIGYKTTVIKDVEIIAWKKTEIDVNLKQTVLQGEAVIIKTDDKKESD